jgi:CRISPR-associated protein Cas2
MVVMVLENVRPRLRGELTRWFLEPKAGVFVGRVSALVRDKLWEKVCMEIGDGGGVMIYSMNTEQGYLIKTCGKTRRQIEDFEGLLLVRMA